MLGLAFRSPHSQWYVKLVVVIAARVEMERSEPISFFVSRRSIANWDQVFRCSVLEVSLQGSVVGPFSALMRKAILKQAKTELPSDAVQLRHTGVTMGSGVL